ncbi:hypothetical protein, partial [Mycolicibacterium insubricum]|uniref:hypothetical protein n=1 Tax=Mycolicibacterium insubricum TaxID=444597 RepID=UPI002AEB6B84|nr:hypothetical protein [Mycolicibacterium insubricum]
RCRGGRIMAGPSLFRIPTGVGSDARRHRRVELRTARPHTGLACRGRDFATAVRRARRALAEFRIRGVSTNIGFLQAVLDDP